MLPNYLAEHARPDSASHIDLLWGTPCDAHRYDPLRDSAADRARDRSRFSARREQEWQVSRALLQSAADTDRGKTTVRSLSHSHGHALVASAPAGWRLGVDLERNRPRRVLELSEWCCDEREREDLRRLPADAALRHFYRLWTFKEAMLKANDLSFPDQLASCALHVDVDIDGPPSHWHLKIGPDAARSHAWSVAVYQDDHWTCCVVIAPPVPQGVPCLQWRALPPTTPPTRLMHPVVRIDCLRPG